MTNNEGRLITFNGVENINKQFYSKVTYDYLKKNKFEETLKKFSFPSYTTHTGQRVLESIKNFKKKDLDIDNLETYTKIRYRRLMLNLLANYSEYQKWIDMHLFHPENVAVINNYYWGLLAHGLAVQLEYTEILSAIEQQCPALLESNRQTLSFFLTTPNLDKIIKVREHLNHYKLVNDNYRQLFLTLAHGRAYKKNITPIFIEIDMNDVGHMAKTCNIIRDSITKFLS